MHMYCQSAYWLYGVDLFVTSPGFCIYFLFSVELMH